MNIHCWWFLMVTMIINLTMIHSIFHQSSPVFTGVSTMIIGPSNNHETHQVLDISSRSIMGQEGVRGRLPAVPSTQTPRPVPGQRGGPPVMFVGWEHPWTVAIRGVSMGYPQHGEWVWLMVIVVICSDNGWFMCDYDSSWWIMMTGDWRWLSDVKVGWQGPWKQRWIAHRITFFRILEPPHKSSGVPDW